MSTSRSRTWPTDRVRLAAILWVGVTRLGIWGMPPARLRRALLGAARFWRTTGRASARVQLPGAVTPGAVGDAVRAASRAVPRATCLVQALAAEAMLARAGFASELHLGVARDSGEDVLRAHAWLAHEGCVIVGEGPGETTPIGSFDATPRHAMR